jgi:hypothetical protein
VCNGEGGTGGARESKILKLYFTSNQTRTDKIYLEGRGYTDLTILVFIFYFFLSFIFLQTYGPYGLYGFYGYCYAKLLKFTLARSEINS